MSKIIVFQGDSITDAGCSKDYLNLQPNEGMGIGYPFLTMAALRSAEPDKDWKMYNRGISGNRVVDLYARWKRDALNLKPDILSILIGVNDTWHEYPGQNGVEVPRYAQFYRMLLEWTKQVLPETKLVLLEPFVLPFGAVQPNWIPEMDARRAVVKELAGEFKAIFIPTQSILNDALKRAPQEYWLKDGVHPTTAGHALISQAWIEATKAIR